MAKSKRKICLVICEVKEKGSPQRKHADSVLNDIIKPALAMKGTGYKVIRIDKKGQVGVITEVIVEELRTSDLVIADLTNLNPNVMYELGIRQAWNFPLIPIALEDQKLPFDVAVLNTVFYKDPTTKKAVEDARREIRKQVRSIIRGEWKNIIFERAISVIGKSYSMDAVYKTFKDALQDMHESLSSCKRDMLYKTMWGDESSLEEFAEDIGGIFATLSAKVHVFRQIAMRDIADPETLDMELVSLLDKADMLKKDGDEIAKAITKRARISVKQKKALSLVENLMSKIRKIAETLKHKK